MQKRGFYKQGDKVLNSKLPALEKQRMLFLSEDFDPGNQWWGSKQTED